ncbi:MAG: alpha/beta fold hydrolase BchO [Sphingomonadaceae bacterium]
MSRPDWNRQGRNWPNRSESRFVDAGGIRFHVQVAGSGPVILLLHGTGAATHSWRDMLPLLAQDFTVIAPDLPGHGFSGGTANQLTLPLMAKVIGTLCDTLSLAPDVIVGHSAGAAIAVRMVSDGFVHPRAIIAANGALLPFPGVAAKIFPAMAQMLFINPFMPRLFALQAAMPGAVESFLKRSTGSTIDAVGVATYEALFRSAGHCAGALGMMANWDLNRIKAELATLTIPLALVYGDRDAAVPPSVSRDVARIARHAELIAMPGLGHLAPEEDPEGFATIIRRIAATTKRPAASETGA